MVDVGDDREIANRFLVATSHKGGREINKKNTNATPARQDTAGG
jgi:hypothetical protein